MKGQKEQDHFQDLVVQFAKHFREKDQGLERVWCELVNVQCSSPIENLEFCNSRYLSELRSGAQLIPILRRDMATPCKIVLASPNWWFQTS